MKRLLVICLLLWVSLGIHTASAAETVTQNDLSNFKELHQAKLDVAKELQQKDAEALRQQVAAVDKRVDDQLAQVGQAVDRYGVASAWIGIAITVLLVGFGLMGIRNAKAEAKEAATEEARKAAKEQADESARLWFEQHADELKSRITELEHKASQVHQQMDNTAKSVADHAENIKKKQELALAAVENTVRNPSSAPSPEQKEAQQVLKERAEELKKSGESSRSFDDWNTLAHAAYATGKLEDAAYFWRKAAEVPNAPNVKVAEVLFNRGITQGQLNQHEMVIATYDDVLSRFGNATEPALREQVAKALIYKGTRQENLSRLDAAIATYDEVVRRFGEATEPMLREQVAIALVKKGFIQGEQGQYKKAIATNDCLLSLFGNDTEPALCEQVKLALNNRGYYRLEHAKSLGIQTTKAKEHLNVALVDFNRVLELATKPTGMILGNKAYALHLLGDTQQAETLFSSALRAPEGGGQELYDTALKFLDKNPIPEDQGARELVERAWAAYQQEQSNGSKEPPAFPATQAAATPPPH